MEPGSRQSHAVRGLPSRVLKGQKIEWLLRPEILNEQYVNVLDIGTGSGGIANFFGCQASSRYSVTSVDLRDEREVHEGYTFVQASGLALPFADQSFHIVITNHVIEHVGQEAEQLVHLKEIFRVMAPGGCAYLAVPNRWMLVEPHYQLAFLSWLPAFLRSPYLRLMGKGDFYDCYPLGVGDLESLLKASGFWYAHMHIESLKVMKNLEKLSIFGRIIASLPGSLLIFLRRVTPTLIYKLRKS